MIFKYKNPIYCPAIDAIRDCQILVEGGRYYLTGTSPDFWTGPNPGVKLYSSTDLLNWRFECLLVDRATLAEDVWYRDRFWAPEIHKLQGRFYLVFNCRNEKTGFTHGCALAVADRITGPYTVLTHERPLIEEGNDLSLYEDDDGRVYAYWSRTSGMWGQEIDLSSCSLRGEPTLLMKPGPDKWDEVGIEGAWVLKRHGTYFMFYSSWTLGYEVGYATAPSVMGPWTKSAANPFFGAKNPVACMEQGVPFTGDPNSPYSGIGHNAVFTGPDGGDWLVCHYAEKGKPESLGFDPIWFEGKEVRSNGPSYIEVQVECPAR